GGSPRVSLRGGGCCGRGQGGGGAGWVPAPARGDQLVVTPARTCASACSLTGRSFGWPLAAARRAALRAAKPVCRVSKAIEAAISTARRVTRPRGSPLDVVGQDGHPVALPDGGGGAGGQGPERSDLDPAGDAVAGAAGGDVEGQPELYAVGAVAGGEATGVIAEAAGDGD